MSDLAARIAEIRSRIARAAAVVGRDPGAVKLLAVSKQQSAARVLEAAAAGLSAFGENRVQEAAEKIPAVQAACKSPLEWHLIGGLQQNSVALRGEREAGQSTIGRKDLTAGECLAVYFKERPWR